MFLYPFSQKSVLARIAKAVISGNQREYFRSFNANPSSFESVVIGGKKISFTFLTSSSCHLGIFMHRKCKAGKGTQI